MATSKSPFCAYPCDPPNGKGPTLVDDSLDASDEDLHLDIHKICIAMLRNAHNLLDSKDVNDIVDSISWIWGTEAGFSFKQCCRVLGLDPDLVRSRFWIQLSKANPDLISLTRPPEGDVYERTINAAVIRRNQLTGQHDLFDFYVPNKNSVFHMGSVH